MAGSSRGRSSSPSRPPWEASSSGLGSLRSSGPAGPPPPSSGQRVVSFSSHRLGRTAAPLAPRSRALAATLFGGLRPGSLRVHDACNELGHGSRLGFPGRRPPRDPAASANVARGLQALLPWQDPGRTQTSFRLPQDFLPSAARGWRRPRPGRPQENFATNTSQ